MSSTSILILGLVGLWLLLRRPQGELEYGGETEQPAATGSTNSSEQKQAQDVTPASTKKASSTKKKNSAPVIVGTAKDPFPAKTAPALIEGLISDPDAINATSAKGGGYGSTDDPSSWWE